jgi:stage V sporulation protein G
MKTTSVQIHLIKEPVGKTRAMAKVILDDELQLTCLRIVEGYNGLFVAYPYDPSYRGDDYRSLFYPVTKELRDNIETKVLAAYKEAVKDD